MSALGGKEDIDQPLLTNRDLLVRGLTIAPGGSKKILGPSARDRGGEPPLCELNFFGKNSYAGRANNPAGIIVLIACGLPKLPPLQFANLARTWD